MNKLTSRQSDVLNAIRNHIAENGMPPTRKEISETLGFKSNNSADEHIRALAKKGAVTLVKGSARGVFPVSESFSESVESEGVPLLGKVAAGVPINAECNETDRVLVDPKLFRPAADYFLTVEGMSMKDIGLFNGDLIAVHHTKNACNGQIVVARWNNQVTVKRYYQKGSIVRLIAENQDFKTIEIDTDEVPFEIDGVMVGSIRKHVH